MDLGNAIALGTLFVSGAGVAIAAIVSKTKTAADCVGQKCPEHSGIEKSIESIEVWLKNIDDKVTILLRNGRGQ